MGLDNPLHIAVLVVLILLVFGAKRLPEIGRSLGTGMREFKDSVTGGGESNQPKLTQQTPAPPEATPPPPAAAQAPPAQAPVEPSGQA